MHESDILAKIPGQFVAAASTMLPEAETAAEATLETIIEVPGQRRVRFTLTLPPQARHVAPLLLDGDQG